MYVPSRHAPQRLDTPIRVALALEQALPCVGDLLALPMQVAQGIGANLLRLERNALALPQSAAGPVQTIGARQQLLALFELGVTAFGVISVAGTEEFGAVRRVRP